MLRKRYTVVVIGEGGTSAAQRSEVSRFRGEREARAAAEEERERLGVVHGDRAGRYRVIVERDGVPLADLTPARSEPAPPLPDLADPAPTVRRLPPAGPADDERDDIEADTGSASVIDEAVLARFLDREERDGLAEERDRPAEEPEAGSTAEHPLIVPADPEERPRERQRARMPGHDDIPSGPVPEEVLRRFEEAIAREEQRRRSERREDVTP